MNRIYVLCIFLFVSVSADIIKPVSVTASSRYPSEGSTSYDPRLAIDDNHATAWFPERTDNANKGEWIKFDFGQEVTLDSMQIINGWIKNNKLWKLNSRIKSVDLEFSNGTTKKLRFKDNKNKQQFNLDSQKTRYLKLIIDDIYAGRRWNHEAGITDIYFYGNKKEYLKNNKNIEPETRQSCESSRRDWSWNGSENKWECVGIPKSVQKTNEQSCEALVNAAWYGKLEKVKSAMASGTDPNCVWGEHSPLLSAARFGVRYRFDGNLNVVKYLVEHGANTNKTLNGNTAQSLAEQFGHSKTAQYLSKHSASINLKSYESLLKVS